MPKLKAVYRCQECGTTTPKWAGQCPGCGAWSSMVEEVIEVRPASPEKAGPRPLIDFRSEVVKLSTADALDQPRIPTSFNELDQLLGGGLVEGQVLLLAGPPGIGKSTLMLQTAAKLAPAGKVLYISGEESVAQISGRAQRLGLGNDEIYLLCETDLEKILKAIETHGPKIIVLDSIQTVFREDLSGSPGSVGQVRECAAELLRAAKKRGSVLFLLGHVTKDGSVAGPKVLEHIVDTVLQFDSEERNLLRILRAPKNRFGPSTEVGLFEMCEGGMREVVDGGAYFIEEHEGRPAPGRAVSVAMEGSRPILVEVQALVTPTRYPLPRRMATGFDLNRVLVLIAALEKHLKLRLENKDVYVNLAGGMRSRDPALDLALCMAVVSSARDSVLPVDSIFVGEVGLLGRLSRIALVEPRLREAGRAGYRRAVIPQCSLKGLKRDGSKHKIRTLGVEDLLGAVGASFESKGEVR